MTKRRLIIRIAVIALSVLLVLGAVAYLLASRRPAAYRPARLTPQQKRDVAVAFVTEMTALDRGCQDLPPFSWSVSQDQLNAWLASLDEINRLRLDRPGEPARRDEVRRALDAAGLAEPAVALRDGAITFMVRSRQYDKVLSADLEIRDDPQGGVRVRLVGNRIGAMPVPDAFVAARLDELRTRLAAEMAPSGPDATAGSLVGLSSDALAGALARVLTAVDAEPIPAEAVWPRNHRPIRIESVRVEPGRLTLRIQPLPRTAAGG